MATVEEVAVEELSLQELEIKRAELLEKLEGIDAQLGNPNRVNPETQERLSGHEWFEWRNRAIVARKHTLRELRKVKSRIAELKPKSSDDAIHEKLDRIESKLDQLLFEGEES